MRVRVTYGLDKVSAGAYYHEQHILDDLKNLLVLSTPLPSRGLPAEGSKGVDTEYSKEGKLLTVGFARETLAEALETDPKYNYKAIGNRCLRESTYLIGHNIPGDIDQLARDGFFLKEDWYSGRKLLDSYLLAKMVDENKPRGSYGLEQLMLTAHNMSPWKTETDRKLKETGDAADWTTEERTARCRTDAWASYMLAKDYYTKLADSSQKKLLIQNIHRIAMTLYRIGLAGAKIDTGYLDYFKSENVAGRGLADAYLRNLAGSMGWDRPEAILPTKDDDIRHLLFDICKLAPVNYTKTDKPSVDKISLKQYLDNKKYSAFIQQLLSYNHYQKLTSVYGDIDSRFDADGFLHFWIQQLGARTGRRSSGGSEDLPSTTNAQNWPPVAKKMIVSRFKGGKIGAFDYQSLEPVLYAWISNDENLFNFFYKGRGYLDICKRVLKQDIEKTSSLYKAIKSMSLGIFYNLQDKHMAMNLWQGVMMDEPFRFSSDFDEHKKETGVKRRQILALFPGLTRYMEKQKVLLARDQQITAPDGYVRHLPHHGPTGAKYWGLVNQAINFPVQHLASMVTGCAMIDCEEAILKTEGVSYQDWHKSLQQGLSPSFSMLINEVHDELTWDLHPHTLLRDKEIILETMKRPPSLTKLIPDFTLDLKIESTITDRWGDK